MSPKGYILKDNYLMLIRLIIINSHEYEIQNSIHSF